MTIEEIKERMDLAIKQDRERFFKVADAMMFQSKYDEYSDELETLKQTFRDVTELENYPEIVWPLELPDWFPSVSFYSRIEEGYLEKTLEEYEKMEDSLNG